MLTQKNVKYNVLDTKGQVSGEIKELKLNVLENSGNYVIHKAILRHKVLNKQRTSSTKTKSEVRGGGRKPWKQKGTGRARAGSNRSPLWVGGGVIFGPKPKILSFKINKKERKIALQTLLYNKRNNISLIKEDSLEKALITNKTKKLIELLNILNISINKKVLIIVSNKNPAFLFSSKNIKNVELILATNVNILSLLKAEHVLITTKGLNDIKEIYCD